jgi:hypothetical protein
MISLCILLFSIYGHIRSCSYYSNMYMAKQHLNSILKLTVLHSFPSHPIFISIHLSPFSNSGQIDFAHYIYYK